MHSINDLICFIFSTSKQILQLIVANDYTVQYKFDAENMLKNGVIFFKC